jgi:hypothetical protein
VPLTTEQKAERRRAYYRKNAKRIIAYQLKWRKEKGALCASV